MKKGSRERVRKLEKKEALQRLLPVLSVPWFDKAMLPLVLSFCDGLLAAIPALELEFTPDPDVKRLLAACVECGEGWC